MAIPVALTEGGGRPIFSLTVDDGSGGLKAALFFGIEGMTFNGEEVAYLAVESKKATTVAVYNVALTAANTEYVQALPAGCRAVIFKCRTAYDVRFAWETGIVATPTAPYQTLKSGTERSVEGITLASTSLYFASATAGVIIEIEAWS